MAHIFNWAIRIYYEDTDAGGVVFYANYLKFFERARTEWLRSCGINQHALVNNEGIVFVVKATAIEYMAPARLDDALRLTVSITRLGHASVSFQQEAWREEKLLACATITVVCINADSFMPIAIPDHVLNCIRSTEPALLATDRAT